VRIGLIVPGFSASEADWCIPALLDLVRALGQAHQVYVYALRYPHRAGRYTVYGAQVHAFGGALASGVGRAPLLARALAAIVAEARRERLDVLHAFWADEPGLLAVTAGRLLGIPAIVSVAGGELVGLPEIGYGGQLSRTNRWMTRRALYAARWVTVGSALLARMAAGPTDPMPLRIVPLGVDTSLFTPAGRADQKLRGSGAGRLLHVASLLPVKDQATLLRAFAQVAAERPDAVLTIAGDGPLRQDLEARAGTLGLSARVRFLGAVAHDCLPDLYRSADLCLLSSHYESQSLAVLEAAACGTPVVGTAVGVMPELAPADCVVAVGDAGALAAAVSRLLDEDDRRHALGRAQADAVRQQYGLEQTVARLVALYDEAARSP
jgi:glycosyltransferase involved in cell wall biosynthesis